MNKSAAVNVPASFSSSRRRQENTDPFDDLLADLDSSTPLFKTRIPRDRPQVPADSSMPQSAGSDFGAFVSVPASSEAFEHPLIDLESDAEPQPMKSPKMSGFFDRFAEEAKTRTNQNERRVLDELLEHEDDPLYWIQPPKKDNDMEGSITDALNSPIPREMQSPESLGNEPSSTLPESPPAGDLPQQTSVSSLSSSFTGTSPRKWMANLLHHNTMPVVSTSKIEPSSSSQRKTVLPEVTHSSPFASHIFIPPTGAPGFTGDYHWNKSGFEFGDQDKRLGRLTLLGRKETTTPILTNNLADQLRSNLPALPRLAKSWTLLYSLDQHGVSLQTLYSRCLASKVMGTMIAIRDTEDRVFGVWLGEQLRMLPGAYYGSGESFLWTSVSSEGERVQVFKWTGKNDYVALCDTDYISFGGGDGKYGLYLDASLTDGSSAPCPTFNNPVLCSSEGHSGAKTVDFECVGIEVWGVYS